MQVHAKLAPHSPGCWEAHALALPRRRCDSGPVVAAACKCCSGMQVWCKPVLNTTLQEAVPAPHTD